MKNRTFRLRNSAPGKVKSVISLLKFTEARTGRLRPRAGVGASASRRLRGRSLRGEGARAAAAAAWDGGPGRLTFVAHSSKRGVTQYQQGTPGAVPSSFPSCNPRGRFQGRPGGHFGVDFGLILGSYHKGMKREPTRRDEISKKLLPHVVGSMRGLSKVNRPYAAPGIF